MGSYLGTPRLDDNFNYVVDGVTTSRILGIFNYGHYEMNDEMNMKWMINACWRTADSIRMASQN